MSDSTVTLVILGSPVTFTMGSSRVEACKKYRLNGRFPPGPCRKNGLPDGAEPVGDGDAPTPPAAPRARRAVERKPETGLDISPSRRAMQVRAAREHIKDLVKGLKPAALRRQVEEELLRQAEITPMTLLRLRAVNVGAPAAVKARGQQLPKAGQAFYYDTLREISFKTTLKPNDPQWQRTYDRCFAKGWFTPTGADDYISAVTAHEFGHHVAFRTYDSRSGRVDGPTLDRVVAPLAKALGVPPPQRDSSGGASREAMDRWMMAHRGVFKQKVSEYGSKNFNELMAETWQEFSTKGDDARPYARAAGAGMRDLAEIASGALTR